MVWLCRVLQGKDRQIQEAEVEVDVLLAHLPTAPNWGRGCAVAVLAGMARDAYRDDITALATCNINLDTTPAFSRGTPRKCAQRYSGLATGFRKVVESRTL